MVDSYDGGEATEADVDGGASEEDVADVNPEGEGASPDSEVEPERKPSDIARLRQRRREAEREAREARREVAELRAQLQPLLERAQREPAAGDIKLAEDGSNIGEYLVHQMRKQESKLSEFEKRIKAEQEAEQAQRAVASYVEDLHAEYAEFAADYPDVYDAGKYLGKVMEQRLADEGYDDDEIRQQIAEREYRIAERARAQGLNPGELLYQAARKAGYKSKSEVMAGDKRQRAAQKGRGIPAGGGSGGGVTKASVVRDFKSGDPAKKAAAAKILGDDAKFNSLPD